MRNQPSLFGASQTVDANPFKQVSSKATQDFNMLALDVATKTGWATYGHSGTWNFTPKAKDDKSIRLALIRSNVSTIIESMKLKVVVYEMPMIYRSKKRTPNFISFEMLGVVKLVCLDKGIKMRGFQAAKIKKFATGNGAAAKPDMEKFCKLRYGIDPVDDNHADALHLYHYAVQELF